MKEKKDLSLVYALKEYARVNGKGDPIIEDKMCFTFDLILPPVIISVVLYMAFAFVIWDIAWVANCEWILRAFYIIISFLFSLAILDET